MSNNWKTERKILLGITGGIAAYKIPSLVRLIKKAGCDVEIIMTESSAHFAAPMTLETLSGHNVWRDKDFDSRIPHIKLSQWAEVFVIAPCTANTLAKLAHGIADNLLTSAFIAASCPVIIFPAMNEHMYDNASTRENLRILSERGVHVTEPSTGALACGDSGKGRMPEPEEIMHEIFRSLCPLHDMAGKHVLVTAGPTHEYIDPVRYISNPSTGKMGASMARTAWYRGANVKIIAGSVEIDSYGLDVIHVKSASDMLNAVMSNLEWSDYIIKAAAVGDYRAKEIHERKIKRGNKESLTLELIQNPDIAAEIGRVKRENQILVGFAAETDDIESNARLKLERKNLDYILANDVLAENSGFASDMNTIRIISRDESKPEKIISGLKNEIAYDIWSEIIAG